MPDGGVLINETVIPPPPFGGVILNTAAHVFAHVGGLLVPGPPVAVLGRVCWFEETTDREQNRTLDGEQRMTRTFQILTSHPLVGSTTVAAFDQTVTPFEPPDPGAAFNGNPNRKVPRPGDKYVELDHLWNVVHTNNHVVCVGVRVHQANPDNLQEWTVVADYAGVADPLAQPHEVDWENVPYQVALIEEPEALPPNPDPRPILNSAKQPFQEGVMVDGDRFQVNIVKCFIGWNPVEAKKYQNTVNANTVFAAQHPPGFEPGTCKIKLSARRVRRSGNNDFYWRVGAVIEIKEEGWDAKVRDQGYMYLPPVPLANAGQLTPVGMHPKYVGKPTPPGPHLLKPNGDLAFPSDPIPAPLVYRRYKRKDWTPLGALLNY